MHAFNSAREAQRRRDNHDHSREIADFHRAEAMASPNAAFRGERLGLAETWDDIAVAQLAGTFRQR